MREIERTVTLTDAVVAIAMTLLILPLVEIADEVDLSDLGAFLDEHGQQVMSFVVSFLVIYVFWAAHGSAFARAADAGVEPPAARALTMWWLLVIAFLPFPTAVSGHHLTTTTGPMYLGTMFVLSALTAGISVSVDAAIGDRSRTPWTLSTTGVFAICTVIALFSPVAGQLGLLSLVVLRQVEARVLTRTGVPGDGSQQDL